MTKKELALKLQEKCGYISTYCMSDLIEYIWIELLKPELKQEETWERSN